MQAWPLLGINLMLLNSLFGIALWLVQMKIKSILEAAATCTHI